MWYQAISSKWPLFLSVFFCCCFPTCFWLQTSLCCLSQPGRLHFFLLFYFIFFLNLVFCYSGLESLSFTEAHFPELSFLSQELSYLLFIPAYLSASINPLPVRDQDPSVYHLIIIFGSFPNLSFSPLKSIICIICYLHFTGSVIFQHFIFTICPEPQALWHFLCLGPYLKVTLEKGFEKHQVSSIGSFFLWTLGEGKTC